MNSLEDKVNGLANSLDTTKAKVNALEKEVSFTRAIALSADRLASALSERIDSVTKNVADMKNRQEKTDAKIDKILDNQARQFKWTLVFILSMFGVFFGLAKWML